MTAAGWMAALLAASIALAPVAAQSGPNVAADAVGRLTPGVPPAVNADASWALRASVDGTPVYRGIVDFDHAGSGAQSMIYPAFGLAGLLAAVATHGVLVQATQNMEKTKLQQQADEVLQPYRSVLVDFDLRQLSQAALDRSLLPGHRQFIAAEAPMVAGLDWLIDVAPVFAMTQDQSALVLDNVIVVRSGDDAATPMYRNIVRVVSQARGEIDLLAYWSADHGAALKAESASLLAQSLDLAMKDMSSAATADPQRTVRYAEGRVRRMERAQLIEESCGRRLLRTLRGWLMSVPAESAAAASAPDPSCTVPSGQGPAPAS